MAARCAGDQGKYWEYHDVLFKNSKALKAENLKQYANDLGLESEPFEACLNSNHYASAVRKDQADGARVGVTGTPAFVINGRFLSGAQPVSAFEEVIDDILGSL